MAGVWHQAGCCCGGGPCKHCVEDGDGNDWPQDDVTITMANGACLGAEPICNAAGVYVFAGAREWCSAAGVDDGCAWVWHYDPPDPALNYYSLVITYWKALGEWDVGVGYAWGAGAIARYLETNVAGIDCNPSTHKLEGSFLGVPGDPRSWVDCDACTIDGTIG